MAKHRAVKKGFDTAITYVTDTSVSSPDVFKITKLPLRFTAGKNLIKLQGNTNNLKIGTLVDVEVLDYNGNPIYAEFINYLDEDKSRVISIYIYEDTPPGDCTVTITGTLAKYNGQSVPAEWRDKPNVKWIRKFPVNPTDSNETEIIFTSEPTITIEENVGVQLDRTYTTNQFPTYTTGTVEYFYRNFQPILQIVGGDFQGDMVGGTITVASPTNPIPTPNYTPSSTQFTSKIKKVLNKDSVTLETPFTVLSNKTISSHTYNHFDPSSFSLSYEADPTYIPTQNSESFALLQINDLDPATGDISRIKVYTNSNGTVGTWEQVNDVLLDGTEIFVDSTSSLTPDQSIGIFTSQSIIDTYWKGHTYLGNSETTAPVLLRNSASISDGMKISNIQNISAKTDVNVVQVKEPYAGIFVGQSQYKVTLDAIGQRIKYSDYKNPKLSIYASGSAFNFDQTDVLNQSLPKTVGKKIGEIEGTAKTLQRFDDIEFEFKSDQSGTGCLLFVIESGQWYIANIKTLTSAEIGYTPNYTRIRSEIPTKHKSDNQLSFKVEYYNIIGDRSKTISYVNNKTWEGGNRYIDGAFSMLTGSLYVADTLESGIDISGLKDTGFIRSLPYGGFNQATGSGAPGFLLFSGSALPNQSETTYEGVGLEMVADANNYFRFRTNPSILDIRTNTIFISGSSVEINTPNFFLGQYGSQYISGSGGNIEISSSNFQLTTDGNINATGGTIGGVYITNTALSSSTTLAAPDGGPAYKLSGSGEISGSELYIRQVFNLTGAGNAVFPLIDTRLGLIDGRNIGRQIVSNYDEIIRANVDDTSEVTVNEHIFQLLPYENSLVVSYQLQARATTGDRVNGTAYFKLYRQTTSGSASDAEWDSWTYVQTMLNYGLTTTALGGPASASHHYINDNITPYSIPVAAEAQFVKVEVCLKNNVIAGSADPDNNTRLKGYSIIATRTLSAETQGSMQAPDVVAPI